MTPDYLPDLSLAATFMLRRGAIAETISTLKSQLRTATEPFVWASLGLRAHDDTMPPEIRSAWIFALKAGNWTGAHFHPNSRQHMIVLEGQGRSRVDGTERELVRFDRTNPSDNQWTIVEPGVPHEFYPAGEDMIVMSFHTARPDELIEVSGASHATRRYM